MLTYLPSCARCVCIACRFRACAQLHYLSRAPPSQLAIVHVCNKCLLISKCGRLCITLLPLQKGFQSTLTKNAICYGLNLSCVHAQRRISWGSGGGGGGRIFLFCRVNNFDRMETIQFLILPFSIFFEDKFRQRSLPPIGLTEECNQTWGRPFYGCWTLSEPAIAQRKETFV